MKNPPTPLPRPVVVAARAVGGSGMKTPLLPATVFCGWKFYIKPLDPCHRDTVGSSTKAPSRGPTLDMPRGAEVFNSTLDGHRVVKAVEV